MLMTKNPKEVQKLVPVTIKLPISVLRAAKALTELREITRSSLFRGMIEGEVIRALRDELEYALKHPVYEYEDHPNPPPLVDPQVLASRIAALESPDSLDPSPTEPVLQLSDFELELLNRRIETPDKLFP